MIRFDQANSSTRQNKSPSCSIQMTKNSIRKTTIAPLSLIIVHISCKLNLSPRYVQCIPKKIRLLYCQKSSQFFFSSGFWISHWVLQEYWLFSNTCVKRKKKSESIYIYICVCYFLDPNISLPNLIEDVKRSSDMKDFYIFFAWLAWNSPWPSWADWRLHWSVTFFVGKINSRRDIVWCWLVG